MRLDRVALAGCLPHQGAMCLLDEVTDWDAGWLRARARSHSCPDHPLRREAVLHAVHGIEYGAQAAAVHGALTAGDNGPPPLRVLAAIRDARWKRPRLDDMGEDLDVTARLEGGDRM